MFPSAVDAVSDSCGLKWTGDSWPFGNGLPIYEGIVGFLTVSS